MCGEGVASNWSSEQLKRENWQQILSQIEERNIEGLPFRNQMAASSWLPERYWNWKYSVAKQTCPLSGLQEARDSMVCNYLPTEPWCGNIAGRVEATAAFSVLIWNCLKSYYFMDVKT